MKAFWRGVAAVCDGLVAPGFGAPGYRARRRVWGDPDITVDLTGRIFAVTGANAGLGLATTRALAARGAAVHMLCRDAGRGEGAREEIAAAVGTRDLRVWTLDVSLLSAVRTLAQRFVADVPRLDGIVHNAGALLHERMLTPEGLEQTFATHVAGPFLLTKLLAPLLVRTAPSRVVFVSSGGMYTQRFDLGRLSSGGEPYDGVAAYAQAKRAQVILGRLWNAQLAPGGVTVSVMHPGWADTGGVRRSLPRFHRVTRSFLRTPEQGADTAVWLVASPEAVDAGGGFYFDRQRRSEHVPLRKTRSTDEEEQALWKHCEDVCGVG